MLVRTLMVARLLVVLALFPALAGCAAQDEPLQRGDIRTGERAAAEWASPEDAEIRPGGVIATEVRDCPINFIFHRPDNGAVFVGTTAYCVRELGVGALGTIGDANLAILIYSSFDTMSEIGETDKDALEYNDFAIFHVDRSSRTRVSPVLPEGGPVSLADGGAYGLGDRLRLFAPSANLPAVPAYREGVVTGTASEWALLTYTVLPGAPGELGGGVLDHEGKAVGVLVTLGVVPNPGANGVARLDTMLAYARDHARLDVELATAS